MLIQSHRGTVNPMEHPFTLHFVDPDSRNRAELARATFEIGHHAEVYSDLREVLDHGLQDGILMVHDLPGEHAFTEAIADLSAQGIWLPIIAYGEQSEPSRIVAAVKAGALDFVTLPVSGGQLRAMLTEIGEEVEANAEARRRMIQARRRIAGLSGREREVLDWLTEGQSNNAIAKALDISPRTVEIHRANMMTKLGARHPADAVRLRFEAQVDSIIPADAREWQETA